MAVFRVEKNRNYTVMSNYHLRNKQLSLKSKGLLSQMLSLPAEWDYTLAGLAEINKEGVDAIRTAIWELEELGYIRRERCRDDKGKMTSNVYTIYEEPQQKKEHKVEESLQVGPILENPTLVGPVQDESALGNPMQINKDIINTDISITDDKIDRIDGAEYCKREIQKNIEYPWLVRQYGRERVDGIVSLMVDTINTSKAYIPMAGEMVPQHIVRKRLLTLTSEHIQYVFECMDNTTTKIRNIRSYTLAALCNAPATMDSYYRAEVNHTFRAMHENFRLDKQNANCYTE